MPRPIRPTMAMIDAVPSRNGTHQTLVKEDIKPLRRVIPVQAKPDDGESVGKIYHMEALVYDGVVSVHKAIAVDAYSVDFARVGYSATFVSTEDDGRRVAQVLLKECRPSLEAFNILGLRSKLPRWVPDWCRAMKKHGKYLDPAPFKE